MTLGYDVFPAKISMNDVEITGYGYTTYDTVYNIENGDITFFGSGFVSLSNWESDSDDKISFIEAGIIVEPISESEFENNDIGFVIDFQENYGALHYIAYDKYVQYTVKDFSLEVISQENKTENYNLSLGYLYSYDLGCPVYDPDLGAEFNPPGYSLNQLVDYGLVEDALKAFMNDQTLNGMNVDSLSTAYISMEALNDFLANNQQESFLGISPEEIYYIQSNIPNSLFYYIDSDGMPQILELPPDPAQKATIWERIAAALVSITVAVVAIVIATTLMVTTAGTMSVAGSMLIGAAIGFGIEFFTQVTINGTPLEKVDWAKVAVSTIAGALSAIPGIGWWGAGLVMGGSQVAMSWIDGNDFKDILLAFGIGFATGVVIHFATKALSKITQTIRNKIKGITPLSKFENAQDIQKALDLYDGNGWKKLDGYRKPHTFANSNNQLPKEVHGFYKTYDIYPKGNIKPYQYPQRFVSSSNGTVWYSPDHYKEFFKIRV